MPNLPDISDADTAVRAAKAIIERGEPLPVDLVMALGHHGVDIDELEETHSPSGEQLTLFPNL